MAVYHGDDPGYLDEALNSIAMQDGVIYDLVVVYDGPVPAELVQSVQESSVNPICIELEHNRGLAVALNAGLDYCLSKGYEYIARMDADDRMRPGRLEKQVQFLDKNPEVDVVGTAISEIDENGQDRDKIVQYPRSHQECLRFFRFRDPLAHPSVMFRSRFFEKAGLYDERLRKNQDTELWFRGFRHDCVFANLPDVLLDFRMNEAFFQSRRGGRKRATQLYRLRQKINRGLNFGFPARIFAIGMYLLTLSPSWLRKIAYRVLR